MTKATASTRANNVKIKWLLVDIGDVLLLKNKKTDMNFNELLAEELGVDIELAREINKEHYSTMDVKYISEADFVVSLQKNLGYSAPVDIFAYFERAYKTQILPNTQFFNFLDEIRDSGVKTAILSNTIAIYRDLQKEAGISEDKGFDPILYSWEVEMTKPNKDIFEFALKKLQAKPEEVVFIDDKTEHLQGAKNVGMRTILFENTEDAIMKIRGVV